MKEGIIKQLLKTDQLLLVLSFGYLGLLFAGRAGMDIWFLATAAFISGKIAHLSFSAVRTDINRGAKIRECVNPEDKKINYKLWLYGILSSAVLIFSSFMLNQLCYYFSIVSVIIMVSIPVLKKYGFLPIMNLRLFEALCPVGGFIAANNRFELIAFILALAVFFNNISLGIAASLYEDQNGKEKKNYITIHFGVNKAQVFSVIFFLLSVAMLIPAGIIASRGLAYWISVLCYAIILIRQASLLSKKDTEAAKKEFMQINSFAAPLLLLGTLIDVFFHY